VLGNVVISVIAAGGVGLRVSAVLGCGAGSDGHAEHGGPNQQRQVRHGCLGRSAAGGKGGWVALHADLNGKPGPVKYEVAVPAGASTNVTIPTPGGIPTGGYWPMLHVDDHTVGTYEFPQVPGADLPAMANGMVVMKKITVTVQ